MPVLLFLLLAALGAAAAILATRNDDETAVIATTSIATTGGGGHTTLPVPPTSAPTTTRPPPTTEPPPTRPRPRPARPIEWPDRDGFTIILQSIPTSASRTQALRTARRALRNGLTDVGVLASSNYPSLQPGYYVVFAGIYDSAGEASSHLGEAQDAGFAVPYVRPVTG